MATKKVVKPAGKTAAAAKKAKKAEQPKEKAEIKRVPPRIVKKTAAAPAKPEEVPQPASDPAQAIAFAMSIAQEKKRAAAEKDKTLAEEEIQLPTRPTSRSGGRNTDKFSATDLKDFRKRLLEARKQAMNGADSLKATGFNESDDHEADGGDGTNQTLRLQALGQVGSINRMIQQIDEALHRIDDGSYGVCTSCGQLIRKPRLLNQPFVQTCMECQSAMERKIR